MRGFVAAYNGTTTVLAGDDFVLPEGGQWTTIDTNQGAVTITDLKYVIIDEQVMVANLYFDNIEIL